MAEHLRDKKLTAALAFLGAIFVFLVVSYIVLYITSADDIRVAVLRYQIAEQRLGIVVFLTIDGHDPSDAFLRRVEKELGPVKRGSLCCEMRPKPPLVIRDDKGNVIETVSSSTQFAHDRETGEHAVIYDMSMIMPGGLQTVRVWGGYYCGNLCAASGYYRVVRRNGHWVVEGYDVKIIS
jgi:hypothetical protein